VGQYSQNEIEAGARLYGSNCAFCHGSGGDSIQGVDLKSGKFRNAVTDDDLGRVITNGLPGTAMPPHRFENAERVAVIAFIRTMRDFDMRKVRLGDRANGRAIVEGKGGCLSCHRINGVGSRTAPDLSEIGAIRSGSTLEAKLLNPNALVLPVNRPVRAIVKTGEVINGRRLNENMYSIQLLDSKERLLSLDKADLKELTFLSESPMSSLKGKLTEQEVADLIAYLISLKGN